AAYRKRHEQESREAVPERTNAPRRFHTARGGLHRESVSCSHSRSAKSLQENCSSEKNPRPFTHLEPAAAEQVRFDAPFSCCRLASIEPLCQRVSGSGHEERLHSGTPAPE